MNRRHKFCFSLLLMLGIFGTSFAQNMHYGFKIGLNSANIAGPTMTGENYATKTGFHIGAIANLVFNERDAFNYGARLEVLYSRRGSNYSYGKSSALQPMYRSFTNATGTIFTTGEGDYVLSIDNSYIEIPITVRARYKKFGLGLGVAPSLLVGTIGEGAMHYTGQNSNGSSTGRIEYILLQKYNKDNIGEAATEATQDVSVGGKSYIEPTSLAAYTDLDTDLGKRYNRFDLGGIVDLNYYFNRTLYLQGRLYYGLSDITNNSADVRLDQPNAQNSPLVSDDFDRNFMIQFSVGFTF